MTLRRSNKMRRIIRKEKLKISNVKNSKTKIIFKMKEERILCRNSE
jgi:hypothetical protein